jgi:hypothetical protein
MKELSTQDFNEFLETASVGDLVAELESCLQVTSDGIVRMSRIMEKLAEKGVDISVYKATPMFRALPYVAAGRLNPNILLRYGHNNVFLDAAAALPLSDQNQLLDETARIQVLMHSAETEYVLRSVRPIDLSVRQIRQVFADGYIRNEQQQRDYIGRLPHSKAIKPVGWMSAKKTVEPTSPDTEPTAMSIAFAAAETNLATYKCLSQLADEAWRKWPSAAGQGARKGYVERELQNSLAWLLIKKYQPKALHEAVLQLLDDARP